ncbi:MAG: flagellin [Phycisphaerales bacterium]
MTVLPVHLARVPTLLSSRLVVSNYNATNLGLLDLQTKISTGKAVNRPSDNPVKASAISVIDGRLAQADQRARNLDHASTVLGGLDDAIGGVGGLTDLVRQAQSIASGQIDSDSTTRGQQAVVIDSLIRSILQTANRSTAGVFAFGGSTPSRPPIEELAGGYRYVGRGSGLLTDLGLAENIPITIGGDNAVGETSARVRSTLDFDPALTAAQRLSDLGGARGLGVVPGTLQIQFGAGPALAVDLTEAQTAGDVATRLTAAIRLYEADEGVTILGPGGVSFSAGAFSIDVAAGGSLAISDVASGTIAADLGLTSAAFTSAAPTGLDVDPRVTLRTALASVGSLTLPLGSIRLRLTSAAGSTVRDIDLSAAQTIDDVRNAIESAGLGARVQVNSAGTAIDLLSEVSGRTLSIEETPGGANTAAQLGLRSLAATTATADFNGGRGVRIVDGQTDPISGNVTTARNADFSITLGNGDTFDVDLRPQDLVNVQAVLDRINAAAAAAVASGDIPAGAFNATLTDGANGIAFEDLGGLGQMAVTKLNNSAAAEDLGLLNGTFDSATSTLVAQDRAAIRVNNLFSDLIDLRDALTRNDRSGITLAGERLQQSADRLLSAHALVGAYGQRVEAAVTTLENQTLLDRSIKSNLQDLDFTDAAVRLSQLQTQLSASLQTAASVQRLTILDFLR